MSQSWMLILELLDVRTAYINHRTEAPASVKQDKNDKNLYD